MSKPLATKVSTPLSENVQIGPKVSIFCVATIIFQHCLNPLGHGVNRSFTGCHWSPLPHLHDDITELVDVRDLALLHLLFEDAPQMLNRARAPAPLRSDSKVPSRPGLCDMNNTIRSVCCLRRAPSQVGYIHNQRSIYKTIFFLCL